MKTQWVSLVLLLGLMSTTVFARPGKNDPGLAAYHRFHGGPPMGPFVQEETPKPRPVEAEKRATETKAALCAQEESKLWRRIAVCDRIKQIALETGDNKLEDEAIRMEQRAEEVYRRRIKTLKTPAPAREATK